MNKEIKKAFDDINSDLRLLKSHIEFLEDPASFKLLDDDIVDEMLFIQRNTPLTFKFIRSNIDLIEKYFKDNVYSEE